MHTIKVKIESPTAQLIEQAACVLGISSAEFIVQASSRRASEVISDQTIFYLDETAYNWFVDFLDNPPPPNEALIALLNTPAPWEEPHPE